MDKNIIKAKIESILFTLGDSVPIELISDAVEEPVEVCKEIITEMIEDYKSDSRGIQIVELENSYQMSTKREMYETLIKITTQPRKYTLTDTLLETLSIIAYKQPVTKSEIEEIRGVKCDHSVYKLMEFNLVEEVGRLDLPGHPLLLGTTEEFLLRFGIPSIDKLPDVDPNSMKKIREEVEEEMQIRFNV